jgi:hypothetical protein
VSHPRPVRSTLSALSFADQIRLATRSGDAPKGGGHDLSLARGEVVFDEPVASGLYQLEVAADFREFADHARRPNRPDRSAIHTRFPSTKTSGAPRAGPRRTLRISMRARLAGSDGNASTAARPFLPVQRPRRHSLRRFAKASSSFARSRRPRATRGGVADQHRRVSATTSTCPAGPGRPCR